MQLFEEDELQIARIISLDFDYRIGNCVYLKTRADLLKGDGLSFLVENNESLPALTKYVYYTLVTMSHCHSIKIRIEFFLSGKQRGVENKDTDERF